MVYCTLIQVFFVPTFIIIITIIIIIIIIIIIYNYFQILWNCFFSQ